MALWTDVIDPATLTGYARRSLEEYEKKKGSLSDYLPNRTVNDIVVRVVEGQNGLVEAAKFRAYDAELEPGVAGGGPRKIVELPALGQWVPVSEYDQLRLRSASDEDILKSITASADRVVAAVVDRMEYMRGQVIATGKATIDQDNFKTEDDFGRAPELSANVGTVWSDSGADVLADLDSFLETYVEHNGEAPGALVISSKVLRALAKHQAFATRLEGGGTRAATRGDVQALLDGYGLPEIRIYDRKVRVGGKAQSVLPDDRIFFLPSAGDSALGASYWGRTLTSTELSWGIASGDQSGVVAGVYKNEKPPVIAQVFADAIGLPILSNANLSMAVKVL